jgi:aryl-phospho-beta-D-glucosidase BglC (GH1 family)
LSSFPSKTSNDLTSGTTNSDPITGDAKQTISTTNDTTSTTQYTKDGSLGIETDSESRSGQNSSSFVTLWVIIIVVIIFVLIVVIIASVVVFYGKKLFKNDFMHQF